MVDRLTQEQGEALEELGRNRLVDLLIEITPTEGLLDPDFRNFIQAMVWCLYCQLRGNLGARTAMMALGEVLATAAEQSPGEGVQVDMIQGKMTSSPAKKH